MSVRLTSSLAPSGPRTRRTCFKTKGSIAGASSSGIPSDNLILKFSIVFVIHLLISGSDFLHALMYEAKNNL